MSEEYQTKMAQAASCEQFIDQCRASDNFARPIPCNFANKAQNDWLKVVQSYRDAIEVYLEFNKNDKVEKLFENLLDLVKTCDEFTSSLAIKLLTTLDNSYQRIEQVIPGAQDQLKSLLKDVIRKKLSHKEMEFWLLLSALDLWRKLTSDDLEYRKIDELSYKVLELGAQVSFRRGNFDNAKGWYREAAKIAQDRIGDTELANHFLQIANDVRACILPSNAFITVMQSEDPSGRECVDAMHQMSIAENLTVMLNKATEKQHSERFLPLVEELLADYESKEDKLSMLLADERLLFNKLKIEEQVAKYGNQGLLAWIPGEFVDSQGNPRGDFDANAHFTVQYVTEVAKSIGALFNNWRENKCLTESHITHLLNRFGPDYDWRIYEVGLSRYFQLDFVSATHLLIPQFENVVRESAQIAGVDIKKFKSGVSGDVLLAGLINPKNTEMRELLGEGVFELVYWYLVNSACPLGYRHKIAHGWIHLEDCDSQLSAMTIWLTLKVINTIAKTRS